MHLDTADKTRDWFLVRFRADDSRPPAPRASPLHRSPRKNLPPSSPSRATFRARVHRGPPPSLFPRPTPPWLPRTRRRAARRPPSDVRAPETPAFPPPSPAPPSARARAPRTFLRSRPSSARPFLPDDGESSLGNAESGAASPSRLARATPLLAPRAGGQSPARRPREREGGTARPPPHPADARFLSCRSPPPPTGAHHRSSVQRRHMRADRIDRRASVCSPHAFSSSRVLLFFPSSLSSRVPFSHPPSSSSRPAPPPSTPRPTQTHKHTNTRTNR